MKWSFRILMLLVLLVVGVIMVGYSLPARTTHTRTIMLKQTPEAIFAALDDVQKLLEWNRNVGKVELLPSIDGKQATKKTFKGGMTMTIVTTESLGPTHLTREIRDTDSAFNGSWAYEISPTADGSKVALTEKADIQNPVFRLMVRIFGPTKYMDEHLIDLGKHFSETVPPR